MNHIFYPLSPSRERRAIASLEQNESVRIGHCMIRSEDGALIGTSINGEDVLLATHSQAGAARSALQWAIKEHSITH